MSNHLHSNEHNSLTRYRELQEAEVKQLRAYCKYLAKRFEFQSMVVNKINPVIAASMLDDLQDAMQVSQLSTDPREWRLR